MPPPGYAIGPATPTQLRALPALERLAARRFAGRGLPEALLSDTTPLAELEEAAAEERLWVATDPGGAPVGFALCERVGERAHLEEVDVHPEHGRRGLGAALVARACEWAREQSLGAVTLTTFREIPWNAPFYRALGFEELPREYWDAELCARVAEEAGAGLEPKVRLVMWRRLGPDRG